MKDHPPEPDPLPRLDADDTRDNLSTLEVAVVALRQDVTAYRWTLEQRMRRTRRLSIIIATAAAVVVLALGGVGFVVMRSEQASVLRAVEVARAERCADLEELRLTLANLLERRMADLRDSGAPDGQVGTLEAAYRRLLEERCTVLMPEPGGNP